MFGGYDPAYNPENLEKKKSAENQELTPEQEAMANKWASTMEDVKPEAKAEAVAENAEAVAIPETEPQLQANLEESIAEETATADSITGSSLNTSDEESAAAEISTSDSVTHFDTLAGASADAGDATETPLSESITRFNASDAGSNFQPFSPEEQHAMKDAAEEAHQATYVEENEFFEDHTDDEDERIKEVMQPYDKGNLVAEAVANNENGASLNGIGADLKADGVDISDEVKNLDVDIAADLAHANMGTDSEAVDKIASNNLAIDAAATALAAKETAGEALAAAETGSDDVQEKIDEANKIAEQSLELATAAETANSESGNANSANLKQLEEARKVATEAKEIADTAQEIDVQEEDDQEDEKDGGPEQDDDSAEKADEDKPDNPAFSADKYPELNDLSGGPMTSIFTS